MGKGRSVKNDDEMYFEGLQIRTNRERETKEENWYKATEFSLVFEIICRFGRVNSSSRSVVEGSSHADVHRIGGVIL